MGDKYKSERYNPKIPHCKQISLLFDGMSIFIKSGTTTYPAYSADSGVPTGRKSFALNFDYSVKQQQKHNRGPIPAGVYWIRLDELWENAWYRRGSTEAWGNYRISIHPFVTTNTYGRGGFFIHGGDGRGSIGCIDLTSGMDKFVKELLRLAGSTRKCQIHLTVKYRP